MIENCKPRSNKPVFYTLFKCMIVLFVSLIDSIAAFYIVNQNTVIIRLVISEIVGAGRDEAVSVSGACFYDLK